MDFLKLYLQQRKLVFLFIFLCTAVFFSSFALYHLPAAAIGYPFALCAFIGLLVLGLDLYRCKKKSDSLCFLDPAEIDPLLLPAIQTPEDARYQQIITALLQRSAKSQDDFNARLTDMSEYYTLWAHQIKTPIASMHLELQNEDTPLSRSLSSGLFRIEQYVDMVLAYMRIDSPTGDYVFREQPIDPIIRGCIRKFACEFVSRKIALEYEPLNTCLITDEKWFSFVLEQILSNALKYTRSGSIHIFLEAPKILCIQDTGIGIAPEDLPRIFELGYTGCNGRTDKKASGIGLYLCRKICRNIGVGITADSKPNCGTCLRLDLTQYPLRTE